MFPIVDAIEGIPMQSYRCTVTTTLVDCVHCEAKLNTAEETAVGYAATWSAGQCEANGHNKASLAMS